jgi:hypothetical protein
LCACGTKHKRRENDEAQRRTHNPEQEVDLSHPGKFESRDLISLSIPHLVNLPRRALDVMVRWIVLVLNFVIPLNYPLWRFVGESAFH